MTEIGGDGMLGVYRQETTWSCLILVIAHAFLPSEGEDDEILRKVVESDF